MTKTKTCSKCGKRKKLSAFYYHRVRKHYMASCKACNAKQCAEYQRRNRNDPDAAFVQRAAGIRRRCRNKGLPYCDDLTGELRRLWREQEGRCYYTNVEMAVTGYGSDPNAVTVDRLDPKQGYVTGNLVLCSSLANRVKQDMTYEELLGFCKLLLRAARR